MEKLVSLEVSYVTVTVNSVRAETIAQLVDWIRIGDIVYRGLEGAKRLLDAQLSGLHLLEKNGINTKINTVVVDGVNEDDAIEVARFSVEVNACAFNCVPARAPGDEMQKSALEKKVEWIRQRVSDFAPVVNHCQQCRADACGLLGERETIYSLINGESPGCGMRPHVNASGH